MPATRADAPGRPVSPDDERHVSPYTVVATRLTSETGEARIRSVVIPLDTRPVGRSEGVSAAELFLTAVAAAVLGGAERAAAALSFELTAAVVTVHGRYDGAETSTLGVDYDLAIATDEPDRRFVQFHEALRGSEGVRRLGVAGGGLTGHLRRRPR